MDSAERRKILMRGYNKAYRERNQEKAKAYRKVHYAKNLERIKLRKQACRKRPENLAREKAKTSDPEWKAKRAAWMSQRRHQPDCNRLEYERAYRKLHKDKQNAATDRWRATPRGTAMSLLKGAKNRCKSCSLEYGLELSDILPILEAGFCQQTGIRFIDCLSKECSGPGAFSASLDRISSARGYIKGNVQIVVWMYNRAKGNGTDNDVLTMARALTANHVMRIPA